MTSTTSTNSPATLADAQPVTADMPKAFTHIGFNEYYGKQHIYTGCFETQASGSVDEVIAYLETLNDRIPDEEESLSWEGSNGRWYSGDEARSLIAGEISALLEGTHSSLNMDIE
jgi:hypothetical protein